MLPWLVSHAAAPTYDTVAAWVWLFWSELPAGECRAGRRRLRAHPSRPAGPAGPAGPGGPSHRAPAAPPTAPPRRR